MATDRRVAPLVLGLLLVGTSAYAGPRVSLRPRSSASAAAALASVLAAAWLLAQRAVKRIA